MINAHLSVNIESRDQTDWVEDLARGLELLAASLREVRPTEEHCTDTILFGTSEVDYSLTRFLAQP